MIYNRVTVFKAFIDRFRGVIEMELLYRIVSLEGFLALLLNKQERFVRPIDCWEDTFEGYMLHLLDTDEGMLQVIERLYYDISNQITSITISNFTKLQRSRFACYGVCWSKNKDSDAMWRIYSYGKRGIQLISSKERIMNMLSQSGLNQSEYNVYEVKYDIENEREAINKILVRNAKIEAAYFHKRPAFEHEAEVRVLLHETKKYSNIDAFSTQSIRLNLQFTDQSKSIPEQIQEAVIKHRSRENYREITPVSRQIDIKNIQDYIEGVRVHPQAEQWYIDLIKKLCDRVGLEFKGQSDLYRVV